MVRSRLPFRALQLESLEGRDVPSTLQIVFDYRFDTNGFFNDPARRAALEQAGQDIASHLNATVDLAPIAASGGNTWTATMFNPSNPNQQVSVGNLAVGTDQIVIFVGAEGAGTGGGEAGLGGFGGYSASGNSAWFNTLKTRGVGGFATWGGSIAFDGGTNWNFSIASGPSASQTDFYTVATHEIGHVLGFGVASQWNALVSGNQFTGANARAANGGTNPHVSTANPGHWQQGIHAADGSPVSMQPYVSAGTRVAFGTLDFAALADIGWQVGAAASPPTATPPVAASTTTAPLLGVTDPLVVGGSNGTFQVFSVSGGVMTPVGGAVTPFAGFGGSVRVATGDFDGDGVKDIAVAAGPGGAPAVKIYSGRTGMEVQSFYAYETQFTGGMFVAAGDINGDGRDDLIVGADVGGGPRVRVFSGGDPNAVMADFWGIDDPNFRGGVRVAVGDINGDGRADLICAAGPGGGPRVAIYDGRSLAAGTPQRLVGDFYAYSPTVQNGAFVAAADYDGDGFADLVLGPGSGTAHLQVISGRVLSQQGSAAALAAPLVSTILQDGGYSGGARVAAGDFDGDGTTDLAVALGRNTNGRIFLQSRAGTTSGLPFGDQLLSDGVYVG